MIVVTVLVPTLSSPTTSRWTAQGCATDLMQQTRVAFVRSPTRGEKSLRTETAMTPALVKLPWMSVVCVLVATLECRLTPLLTPVECVLVITRRVLDAMER